MEYTVQQLARLAGVSARTLRYYDQIGLLCPRRVASSGYRIYGKREVDLLQQILFYRELELPLEEIRSILHHPDFDRTTALRSHHRRLLQKRDRLNALLQTVQQGLAAQERGIAMQDHEKFEGFKQNLIETNERAYGAEIRARYGQEAVDSANHTLLGLSPQEYERWRQMEAEILSLLDSAWDTRDPAGAPAMQAAALHRQWLGFSWNHYSPEAHAGLAAQYADDERFAAYYDRGTPGKAAFFRDCLLTWLAANGEGLTAAAPQP